MDTGESVGGLSDVGELGDEWSFTLYDGRGREVVAFAYHDEAIARRAHKAMQMAIGDAVAVSPAFEIAIGAGFVPVQTVRP